MILSVALGSLAAGTIVALVTGLLANRLARDQEDSHLRHAAGTLAFELLVKGYDPQYAVRDETHELAHTGIVVAVFEGERLLAGDPGIPFVAPGACVDASRARVCAVAAKRWVSVAARDRILMRTHAQVTSTAAGVALLLMLVLSAGIARLLAYAAVKPLDRLANAVQKVPAHGRDEPDLGSATGVAEVDALRSSLVSAFDALRQALLRSRSFVGDAAHQLRTPLATILGELDLALESEGSGGHDQTRRARGIALRLSTLVDRLLILANPDETLQGSSPVSLLDVLEDALETLPEAARQRIECGGSAVMLEADPGLLVNAIASALEHTLESASGRVRADIRARDDLVILAIGDDRPSIVWRAGEELLTNFEPKRDDRAERLWLAVIARVTSLHGGTVRFAEREGSVSFEFTFPRAEP